MDGILALSALLMGDDRLFSISEVPAKPETAHVLFADIVGYSRLASDEQPGLLQSLRNAVHHAADFNSARAARTLLCLPTGDGMALVFFGNDVCAPIRTAIEISTALRASASFGLRIGIHTGPVFRVPDINGSETVVGAGINLAQRVMDCGDAGHILLSSVHASFLQEFEGFRPHIHDLGEAEVKHGLRLQLASYFDGAAGNAAPPVKLTGSAKVHAPITAQTPPASCAGATVVVVYKRGVEPDVVLLRALESGLTEHGCTVFIDRHLRVGMEWAREIERTIRSADAVIPLLSPTAVTSEMLALELEIADEAAQQQDGRPRILPVRVNWEGPLPDSIRKILDPIQYTLWRGSEDTAAVIGELTAALNAPSGSVRRKRALEPPGGAMPLDSIYYIERPADADVHEAIARGDSLVLVQGARQMGKTSLLSRGLQRARRDGARVACTDFQKLNASDLTSLESFYMTLGTALANQLDLDKFPEDTWRPKSGPNENFERYLRREVLGTLKGPLVWALDEVDRLFTCSFGTEVFGLFRAWHNVRALDPESPWRRLTQVICYATEAHLFISDLNQSPFNVGTRVRLNDFGLEEVSRLNQLYGEPLRDAAQVEQFQRLFGGQPYLVQRALHELVTRRMALAELEQVAASEEGPFSDHLKRFLVLLSHDPEVLAAVRNKLRTSRFTDPKIFYRLRAAGLLRGATFAEASFRCDLYEAFLRKHLS